MILGVVALSTEPVQLLSEYLKEYTVLSETDSGLEIDKLVNNLESKCSVIQAWEEQHGKVLVHGNVLLDRGVAEWILNRGGRVVIVFGSIQMVSPILDSTAEPISQYFQDKWTKQPLDGAECYGYDQLLEMCKSGKFDEPAQGEELVVTNEESIRQARMNLGLDIDPPTEPVVEPVSEPIDTTEVKSPMEQPVEELVEDNTPPVESVAEDTKPIESPVDDPDTDLIDEVVLKIKGGTIALLVPQSKLSILPTSIVNGVSWITLVFRAPDLGNTQLQRLKVLNGSVKRVPIKLEKTELTPPVSTEPPLEDNSPEGDDQPVKVDFRDLSLDELKREKQRLDEDITKARREGNTALVEGLRKQRHAVRNQINKHKG